MKDLHAQVVELLPWYVNGTLSVGDRDLVERHCGECLPCRRALRDEQSACALLRGAGLPTAEATGLARLIATIDRRETTGGHGAAALFGGVAGRAALAAGFGIAAVVAVWMASAPPDPVTGSFTTSSTPASADAPRIDLIFASDAAPAAIDAIVTGLGGTVVAGPSEIGRYTIALPAGADVQSVLTRVRDDPRVRFAGPTFIED